MKFIELVHKHQSELTKSEEKLAEYIAANNEKVIYDTIKSLGKATSTGDATIIRLCKKLGFSGFSQLKISLAQQSMLGSEVSEKRDSSKTSEDLLISSIHETRKLIDHAELDRAIDLLINAKRVYIFGIGHSGESARDYAKTWLRIGFIAHAEVDPHIQVQIGTLLGPDDVVVGLSLSGHTKDTYDSLKLAKDNGAKIITVSNDLTSPISKLGDAKLQTAVKEFLNIGSVAGQVSQLYLCDVIGRRYEEKTGIDSNQVKERALKAIMKKSI